MIKNSPELERAVRKLVYEYNIREENLTQRQLVEAIKQAIAAGDFIKHVSVPPGDIFGSTQCIVYIPYRCVVEHQREVLNYQETIAGLQQEILLLRDKLSKLQQILTS